MELRQLRYFIAVVDAQSITAAARKLHLVQSAVSHQISNLEDELQASLLLRTKSGVKATTAGQLLYRHALVITKQLEAVRDGVKQVDKEVRGKVAIGLPNSTAAVLALPILKAVRAELPHVELTIVEGLSGLLSEQLANGKLDFSVLFETEPMRGFEVLPLFKEKLHFVSCDPVVCRQYARSKSITLRSVMKRPLILPPKPNGIRLLLEKDALRAGLNPRVVADITGLNTMLAAVKAGLADSVMMAVNADSGSPPSKMLILPISSPVIERAAGLFYSEHFELSSAAICIKDITLRAIDELISGRKWRGATLSR